MSNTLTFEEKYYDGESEFLETDIFELDEKIVFFNQKKSQKEQDDLRGSLMNDGQREPIYYKNVNGNYLVGDGRYRLNACKELGIEVKAQKIKDSISEKDYIRICNFNTFQARNDSPTQKAIKAYHLVLKFGYSDREAIRTASVKDKTAITNVRTIYDNSNAIFGTEKTKDLMQSLLDGGPIMIIHPDTDEEVYRGKALKTIASKLKNIVEEQKEENMQKEEKLNKYDYNKLIESEKARKIFWDKYGNNEMISVETKLFTINLLNSLFKENEVDTKKQLQKYEDFINSLKENGRDF